MGNVRNVLRFLFILKKGALIKGKDIAEELEVSLKQVRRYKEILDEFFYIESIKGPNGGYILKDKFFPFKEVLSEREVIELQNIINSLDSDLLVNNINLKNAINKINYTLLSESNEHINEEIVPYSRIRDCDELYRKTLENIYEGIANNYEIFLEYTDNQEKTSKRKVQPYLIFIYKGEKYLAAYCVLRKDVRFFKLARIKQCIITSNKFNKNINMKDFIKKYKENNIGIFNGKDYNVVLKINPPLANTIEERIWVDNQKIEKLENGSILFSATMKDGPELISWILSMGDAVQIIEPDILRNQILEKIDIMKNKNKF